MIRKILIFLILGPSSIVNALGIPYLSAYTLTIKNDEKCALDIWLSRNRSGKPCASVYDNGEISFRCRRNFFLYLSFGFYNKLNGLYKISWGNRPSKKELKVSEIVDLSLNKNRFRIEKLSNK